MKVAVINMSGNVGKTTVAVNLLKPRMPETTAVFSVESINQDASADGLDVERIKGKKFGELQHQLMMEDDAIVDVGASNVEDYLKLMQQFSGSHGEYDYFVVPVVKDKKQQGDTVKTIQALAALGVEPGRIRVVFNKLDVDETVEGEFPGIVGLATTGVFTLTESAVIYANEAFEKIKGLGITLDQLASDSTDYRQKMRETSGEEREKFARLHATKQVAISAKRNLDQVFAVLFA